MGEIKIVADIPDDYSLIVNQDEVLRIMEDIGADVEKYRGGILFVRTESADYSDVFWCDGSVPVLSKRVTRLL